jgi:hypothetical protein
MRTFTIQFILLVAPLNIYLFATNLDVAGLFPIHAFACGVLSSSKPSTSPINSCSMLLRLNQVLSHYLLGNSLIEFSSSTQCICVYVLAILLGFKDE